MQYRLHPRHFDHVARELDLWPGAILHVGDSEELDLQGAMAAGFRGLHLRRENGVPPGELTIRSLAELPEKLEGISPH